MCSNNFSELGKTTSFAIGNSDSKRQELEKLKLT